MTRLLIIILSLSVNLAVTAQEQQQEDSFNQCLQTLQEAAREQQIPDQIIDEVVGNLHFQQRVIELDRAQPEFTQSFADYLNKRVTPARVLQARKLYAKHRHFLNRLAEQYGVPGQYLIAFWGMETNFGSYLGKMPTLDSLATLACDQRRSEFFTRELMAALRILKREGLQASEMKGSWAGAVGHTQFMPSAYEQHAIDGDGNGKIDLWGSHQDALASAANFLNQLGWQTTERWGREVLLPPSFPYSTTGRAQQQSLTHWRKLGVTRTDGQLLPALDIKSSILVPMGHTGPAFIVYNNFKVIMRWNFSESYAIAVGHLADRIAGGSRFAASMNTSTPVLTPQLIINLQQRLTAQGFDAGKADGIIGSGTRSALRGFQASKGLVADGFPGFSTFSALGIDI